ncbi:MAG: tRNA (adenosine(37)-N6)-dimethylallyltransferase MiaA [Bacteroidetes bacterium]|nr:tRNA (adenosine(37)-N6)-dimethylallyltransferase MiaA [Bacteroidota bacterium]
MKDTRPGPFLVLAGPTGVGKTALSLTIASRIGAEIVSADSRQVFRGLDIGTAKPSWNELAAVPHHFIDECNLGSLWSAGRFAEEANGRIAHIIQRGAVPLVVGGSTLYLEALVHGLADIPDSDPAIRAELNEQVSTLEGAQNLFEELERIDPEGAETLDPTKTQRLVRALEVYRTTGEPWSSFFAQAEPPPYRYRVVVLTRLREELYARIEARVDAMLDAGLLEENRGLMDAGFKLDTNPLRTIGYQEPFAHLSGEIDYDEMVRLLKRNTRRYAKRQLTWFRRRPEYEWVDLSAYDSTDDAAEAILS